LTKKTAEEDKNRSSQERKSRTRSPRWCIFSIDACLQRTDISFYLHAQATGCGKRTTPQWSPREFWLLIYEVPVLRGRETDPPREGRWTQSRCRECAPREEVNPIRSTYSSGVATLLLHTFSSVTSGGSILLNYSSSTIHQPIY